MYALCEIQELAYQRDCDRSQGNVLHFYLKCLEFSIGYTAIFSQLPESLSPRKIFGAPYHAIVSHMPTMYRYISLKSIAAEAEERQFNTLRYIALLKENIWN